MNRGELLRKDWFLGLLVALLFLILAVNTTLFSRLESLAYDTGLRLAAHDTGAAARIVVVSIDDESIKRLGRWPWPRTVLADLITKLNAAGAKTIGLQILLTEKQAEGGLAHLERIAVIAGGPLKKRAPAEAAQILQIIDNARLTVDADRKLGQSLAAAGNVVMPMYFEVEAPLGTAPPVADYLTRNALGPVVAAQRDVTPAPATRSVTAPLPGLGSQAAAVGHLNIRTDVDGAFRQEMLVLEHQQVHYPSIALALAARELNVPLNQVQVLLGEGVRVGALTIPTDANLFMRPAFYQRPSGKPAFDEFPAHQVLNGQIDSGAFRDKIVILGATANGVGDAQVTPLGRIMHTPEITATVLASILNRDFYTEPSWGDYAVIALYLAVLAYLLFLLPRLGAGIAAVVSAAALIGLIGGDLYLLSSRHLWLATITPAMLLLLGHVALTTRRYFMTERAKDVVERDVAQTNRQLGLAFQNQGQLDMAWDKFRSLPVDDSVLELSYNLALDFERKRQFSKAVAVYDYILGHNKKFRDVSERRERAQQADQSMLIGGGRGHPGGTVVFSSGAERPTIGRYTIERELGKGAMGAVFYGVDARINRPVAIKTMALAQEFEGDALEEARKRFFREAETAGRLSHRSIVSIYDAGEDQDLGYIAMEFLEGGDLTRFIGKEALLPVPELTEIVCEIADALHYAHEQDVVHRDIKPANIMYHADTGNVKVTDFGIARVTASSKTKTGMILGTPSYMSPEQLAGKHVDGRSDLFSLGVMTYELLAGELPFQGDSITTLMYQIANSKHPEITARRTDLPACLNDFFDKALHKDPAQRFQTGREFCAALRECLANASETVEIG
jgi:serine/threonine-protein kinase